MKLRIAAALLGAGVLLETGTAEACSPAGNATHVVASTPGDTIPPDSATLDVSVVVQRGHAAQGEGCSTSMTSCDDLGSIQLLLNEPATDDQTSAENMGYLVEVVDGILPGGLTLAATAVRAMNGTLFFHWPDDDTDAQEIVAFSVTLTPIDSAGNTGPASDPIRIFDPGSSEGCAVARRSSSFDAVLLLAALAGIFKALGVLRARVQATPSGTRSPRRDRERREHPRGPRSHVAAPGAVPRPS